MSSPRDGAQKYLEALAAELADDTAADDWDVLNRGDDKKRIVLEYEVPSASHEAAEGTNGDEDAPVEPEQATRPNWPRPESNDDLGLEDAPTDGDGVPVREMPTIRDDVVEGARDPGACPHGHLWCEGRDPSDDSSLGVCEGCLEDQRDDLEALTEKARDLWGDEWFLETTQWADGDVQGRAFHTREAPADGVSVKERLRLEDDHLELDAWVVKEREYVAEAEVRDATEDQL